MRRAQQAALCAAMIWSTTTIAAEFGPVVCEGNYSHHLQGVASDQREHLYWSFTTTLVKTDLDGNVVQQVEVDNHHGDLCLHDGKVFVAVNLGPFNDPEGKADSWVYVYDASNLAFLSKHPVPQILYGAGGIDYHDGQFWIVGGLPKGMTENLIFQYDTDFALVKKHTLESGPTTKGIQTANFAYDQWWFGCYGKPAILLTSNASLNEVQRFEFNGNLGMVPIGDGKFLVARGEKTKDKRHTGRLVLATVDDKSGLQLLDE